MRKDLDNNGLIYFSNKLKIYLSKKFKTLVDNLSDLEIKVDFDNKDLNTKIDNSNQTLTKNTIDIQNANTSISNLSTKVDNNYTELRTDFDSVDMRPTGDSIYINNVEQFVFKDITAGEVVTIPNSGDGSDFLIECFVQTEQGTPLKHKVLDINTTTKDLLEYDNRYVEITDSGAKPKDSVSLKLNKIDAVNGYNVYITDDFIPIELVDSIDSLTDYSLTLDETTP